MSDKWNIQIPINKQGVWSYYLIMNYQGLCMCIFLIYSVITDRRREVSDIFVMGIAFGIIFLSSSCGTQCLFNLIANRFVGADAACQIEGIVHVSSIVIEFLSVTQMAISFYLTQVKSYKISHKKAFLIIIGTWFISVFITCMLSLVSELYLVSNQAYCFFEFRSPAIAGWLLPCLIVALAAMTITHILIVRHYNSYINILKNNELRVDVSIPSTQRLKSAWINQFRWKSTLFILILLGGWFPAIIAVIYEFAIGPAPIWNTTMLGVTGVSYSVAMPITFSFFSEHYRKILIYVFGWILIPYKGKEWWRQACDTHPRPTFTKSNFKRSTKPSMNRISHIEKSTVSPTSDIEIASLGDNVRPSLRENYFTVNPLVDSNFKEVDLDETTHPSDFPFKAERPSEDAAHTEGKTIYMCSPLGDPITTEAIYMCDPLDDPITTEPIYMCNPLDELTTREGQISDTNKTKLLNPPSPVRSRKNTLDSSPKNNGRNTPSPKNSRRNSPSPNNSRRNTPSPKNSRRNTPSPKNSRRNTPSPRHGTTLGVPTPKYLKRSETPSPRFGLKVGKDSPSPKSKFNFKIEKECSLSKHSSTEGETPLAGHSYAIVREDSHSLPS